MAVHQRIVYPEDVPAKFVPPPQDIVEGDAVALVGAGAEITVTIMEVLDELAHVENDSA